MGNRYEKEIEPGDYVCIPPYTGQVLQVTEYLPKWEGFKGGQKYYEIAVNLGERCPKDIWLEPFPWGGVLEKRVVWAFRDEICKYNPNSWL